MDVDKFMEYLFTTSVREVEVETDPEVEIQNLLDKFFGDRWKKKCNPGMIKSNMNQYNDWRSE